VAYNQDQFLLPAVGNGFKTFEVAAKIECWLRLIGNSETFAKAICSRMHSLDFSRQDSTDLALTAPTVRGQLGLRSTVFLPRRSKEWYEVGKFMHFPC
jgi:hypothetical protein